ERARFYRPIDARPELHSDTSAYSYKSHVYNPTTKAIEPVGGFNSGLGDFGKASSFEPEREPEQALPENTTVSQNEPIPVETVEDSSPESQRVIHPETVEKKSITPIGRVKPSKEYREWWANAKSRPDAPEDRAFRIHNTSTERVNALFDSYKNDPKYKTAF